MDALLKERIEIYNSLEKEFNSKIIAFVTGDRENAETSILPNQVDLFVNHLDRIGSTKRITLLIYTCGGSTLAAWNIINLLYEYCDEVEIVIPNKCRSSGTLMALGAHSLIMTKQATLGPIDPSITGPLSPVVNINNSITPVPVSVESVNGYFELLKKSLHARDKKSKNDAFIKMSNHVNPLLLGDVYRAKKQIKMLAKKLIKKQKVGFFKTKNIINFLCSDSGSHDYTISRSEARELGLKVLSPSPNQYQLLKKWYDNIVKDLSLKDRFDPSKVIASGGRYGIKRGLIESISYGSDYHISEGYFISGPQMPGQIQVQDNRLFDGWKHEDVEE